MDAIDGLVTAIACAGPRTAAFDALDEWDALTSDASWALRGLAPSGNDGDSRIPDD
jgi:hypothetical protein